MEPSLGTSNEQSASSSRPDLGKRFLVVYFSFTGNTRKVAEAIRSYLSHGATVVTVNIQPTRTRTYFEWLGRSLMPNSKVRIKPLICDFSVYDLVFLGFPKWTLSCPPVNEYLETISGFEGKEVALFMTYAGFDEIRYTNDMLSKVRRKSMHVLGTLAIRRRTIQKGAYFHDVANFCELCIEALSPHNNKRLGSDGELQSRTVSNNML